MSPPPRLLLLNYEYPPIGGGAANATLSLARSWANLGCRPVVVTSGHGPHFGTEVDSNVTIHRLDTGRKAADRGSMRDMAAYAMASLRHAPGIAREAGCTGVVAFFTLPSGLVARWLNSRLNLPYLVSLRGSDVPGHDRTLDRMHALTRPIRRAVLRRASALVANSDGLAATSRAADPFPIEVVPNGVDCSRFTPAPVAPPPGRFRLLFVGRVHREKNLRPVVEALRELPQVGLIVAGDGPQRAELEALAVHQGVAERIQWLGWQGKAALPELYRGAHALINPSLYEGMPNVVLEGMASGLAVIGSDTPGNRSVIADRETGLLFPLGDDRALADCIRGISRDEALRKRLAANGRLSAERNFSWDKSAAHYLELLGRSGR